MLSMTGYGRVEKVIDDYSFIVEIKTLNGKYLNLKTYVSGLFSSLEVKVQNYIKKEFKRGNLNVYIEIKLLNPENFVEVDFNLAKSYNKALSAISRELHLTDDVSLEVLTKFREIIKIKLNEEELDKIWNNLIDPLSEAIKTTKEFQTKEGENLKQILNKYIQEVEELIYKIEKDSQEMKKLFSEKLNNNLKDLLEDKNIIDNERLELEVALLAEKADISEEIDRLNSHIKRFKEIIGSKEQEKGHNLDFLTQEMHREFNTISSKSRQLGIINYSIDGKSLINKLREQVQNVM